MLVLAASVYKPGATGAGVTGVGVGVGVGPVGELAPQPNVIPRTARPTMVPSHRSPPALVASIERTVLLLGLFDIDVPSCL